MGAYKCDDPAIAIGRAETERRNLIRCETCGVPKIGVKSRA